MRSSDYLFHLIKSLTKGERRNFKLFAKLQDGDKKYIQLFDAISKQGSYDEKKILNQFKGERFTKQFSVAKNYLYNYLLKTLIIFQKDQQTDLTNLMSQIRVLLSKNLFQQAHKLVRKAKLMAERQERFKELLELLDYERTIYKQTSKIKEFRTFIKEIQEKEDRTLERLRNLLDYQHLHDQIQIILGKSEDARTASDLQTFDEILLHPLILDEEAPLSVRAKLLRLRLKRNIVRFSGDTEGSLQYTLKLIQVFEKNPTILKDNNLTYILDITNLAVLYYYSRKDREKALVNLEKLRNLATYTPQEELRIKEKYYHFLLALAVDSGDKELGDEVMAQFEDDLKSIQGKIRKTIELGNYYSAAYFYLTTDRPGKALPWVNRLLNEPRTELRSDLQSMARLMNLIIHFELGNFDSLEYLSKQAYRFIFKRERLFKFEKSVLKLIKELAAVYGTQAQNEILEQYRTTLNKILEDPFEQNALNLLDMTVWTEAKLRGISMAEYIAVVREKDLIIREEQ